MKEMKTGKLIGPNGSHVDVQRHISELGIIQYINLFDHILRTQVPNEWREVQFTNL